MNCSYIVSVSNKGFQEHNKISFAKKIKSLHGFTKLRKNIYSSGDAVISSFSSGDPVLSSFSQLKIFGVNNFLQK